MRIIPLFASGLCCIALAGAAHAAPVVSYFPANDVGLFLAKNFDLASIRSSFGPSRASAQRTFADMQMKPSAATNDLLEFKSDTWFYQLRIVERRDVNGDGIEDLAVCFTDQALGGATYYSQSSLLVTRYSVKGYAVAINYSVDACNKPVTSPEKPAVSDAANYQRIGNFIFAFQRAVPGAPETLTAADLAQAPADLAQRARQLAQKHAYIAKNFASVTDADMDATLREARLIGSELATWRAASRP